MAGVDERGNRQKFQYVEILTELVRTDLDGCPLLSRGTGGNVYEPLETE